MRLWVWAAARNDAGDVVCEVTNTVPGPEKPDLRKHTRFIRRPWYFEVTTGGDTPDFLKSCSSGHGCRPHAPCGSHTAQALRWWEEAHQRDLERHYVPLVAYFPGRPPLRSFRKKAQAVTYAKTHGCPEISCRDGHGEELWVRPVNDLKEPT